LIASAPAIPYNQRDLCFPFPPERPEERPVRLP
jgi:hypothetical protein